MNEVELKNIIKESLIKILKENLEDDLYRVNVFTSVDGEETAFVTKCFNGERCTGTYRGATYDDGYDYTEYGKYFGSKEECKQVAQEINDSSNL